MHQCDQCDQEFLSYRQLNGHKSIHRDGGRYSPNSRSNLSDRQKHCAGCNDVFVHDAGRPRKYCNKTCYHTALAKNRHSKVVSGSATKTPQIRRYFVETGNDKCFECGQPPLWNNKPLVLEVDHIDGNSDNNALSNLRLLCPHCHSQMDTSKHRIKKNTKRNRYLQQYKAG